MGKSPLRLTTAILSLAALIAQAQTPIPLRVHPTTGAITGPVDAATFKTANSIGGGGGGDVGLAADNNFTGYNTFTLDATHNFNVTGPLGSVNLYDLTAINFQAGIINLVGPTTIDGALTLSGNTIDGFMRLNADGSTTFRTYAQVRTDLGLGTAALISSTAGGDLSGTLPSPTVTRAATLTTSRQINGVAFNGSADITVTAAAGTLTGGALASGVTSSSLTTFGASPGVSGTLTESNNNIASTTTNGVVIQNTTASTVGTQVQISPALTYIGHGWGTSSTTDAAVQFRWDLIPVPAATTPTGKLTLHTKLGAAGENTRVTIDDLGALAIPTTAPLTAGTIELGALTDTTIARVGAGQISIEGVNVVTVSSTDSLTNKTIDAAASGNVLKFKSYLYLGHPDLVDGTGATLGTTATAIDYGHATFSNSADESANYVEYRLMVPQDIDTSVELRARLQFRLTAADTAKHRYTLNTVSQADSSSATGTVGTPINLDFTGDASGASGDVESVGFTTLTGWAATMTAGRLLVVRLARDGNDGTNDTSTVNSTELGLVLEYGSSQ